MTPASALYEQIGRLRRRLATPWRTSVPVICVGNLVVGGAGKTPVVLALADRLKQRGIAVHLLTRGYRGRLKGPVAVEPHRYDFRAVGDEALLLAEAAPTWVSRDRAVGAEIAVSAGAQLVLMDDGLQNPTLIQDLRLLVVDGEYGFGNGQVLPAGPLRESVEAGLARADAAILLGEDTSGIGVMLDARMTVIRAVLRPAVQPESWAGKRVVAFAGIGRPAKFFATLDEVGAEITARFAFPDHHPYSEGELAVLMARAAAERAEPVTTMKDWVRLSDGTRPLVTPLPVAIEWGDATLVDRLLDRLLAEP